MTSADQAPPDALGIRAERHVRDILTHAVKHTDRRAVLVADERSYLSRTLARAYRACLPDALYVDFDAVGPEQVLQSFDDLQAGDLVVLVQSSSFRLGPFRIRVELFKRGLKVIEHPHLGRMPESEHDIYVDALAYDPAPREAAAAHAPRPRTEDV